MRDAVEGRLHVERREQPRRVREEQRPPEEPLPVGDVPEAPHPSDDLVTDALRDRLALEQSAVREADDVEALLLRVA